MIYHIPLTLCLKLNWSHCSILSEDSENIELEGGRGSEDEDDLDLPLLTYSTLVTATDNFSIKNKIGEGGFGPVYKVIKYILCRRKD